jgi:hypothetical protein
MQHRPDVAAAHLERAESHVADRAEGAEGAERADRAEGADRAGGAGRLRAGQPGSRPWPATCWAGSTPPVVLARWSRAELDGASDELDLLVSATVGAPSVPFVSDNR